MNIIGQTIGGRYLVCDRIGEGNFGETYLATDTHLPDEPKRVIKRLKPQFSHSNQLAIVKRLFDTEAKTLYKLGNHLQIPQLFAHFEENKDFYLVQEYVEGTDLSKIIYPGTQLSELEVINLLKEILEILKFVHQEGVIHRDIKPSNLMRRTSDGKIIMIDFGAVKQISSKIENAQGQTIKTIAIGTPGYMPSEQIQGNPKFCSDIYAVGMLGIYALTGIPPNQLSQDTKNLEVIWQENVSVSPKLARIINKMVRHNFNERYQTTGEVLHDFLATTLLIPKPIDNPPKDRLKSFVNKFKYILLSLEISTAIVIIIFSILSFQETSREKTPEKPEKNIVW